MDHHDDTENRGRKGVAYDWRSVLVAEQLRNLGVELVELLSTPA